MMNTLNPESMFRALSPRAIARIIAVIFTIVLLIAFNVSHRSDRAPLQNDFDVWLQSTKQTISQSIETAPPVTVALVSDRPEFKADWKISLLDGGDPQRVVRLLDLAQEANIFSRSTSRDTLSVRLTISDGTREFVAALSPNEISSNVEAGNLIKLFQLYALETPRNEPLARRGVATAATEEASPAKADSLQRENQ